MNNKRESLKMLDALRGVTFLGVFMFHTELNVFRTLGGWGVSVFFVLSGFLMVYSYWEQDRIKVSSVKDNIVFGILKMKKLYPIHIITTLAASVFLIMGSDKMEMGECLIRIVSNVFFIQSWFPIEMQSINTVSWFLCTIFLFYIIFPWILCFMEKKYTKKTAWIMLLISVIMMGVIGITGYIIGNELGDWFIYKLPLSRIWDIFIGCSLGYIYINKEHSLSKRTYTVLEVVAIITVIISNILVSMVRPKYNIEHIFIDEVAKTWWSKSFVYICSTCILIYIFAIGKGYLSSLFARKSILHIAKLSPYAYLISGVVLQYLKAIYHFIPGIGGGEFAFIYGRWISLTIGLLLTIIASEIWVRISNYISTKFHK